MQRGFIGYDAQGEIVHVITPGISPGGWPDGFDITAATPQHPLAVALRQDSRAVGFIPFDCPCDEERCDCACIATYDYYVENGALVERAPLAVKVDGVTIATSSTGGNQIASSGETPTPKPPEQPFTLRIEQAGVPDGTQVTCVFRGAVFSPTSPLVLTFQGGVAEAQLTAPGQGTVGSVRSQFHRYVRRFAVGILGWAS